MAAPVIGSVGSNVTNAAPPPVLTVTSSVPPAVQAAANAAAILQAVVAAKKGQSVELATPHGTLVVKWPSNAGPVTAGSQLQLQLLPPNAQTLPKGATMGLALLGLMAPKPQGSQAGGLTGQMPTLPGGQNVGLNPAMGPNGPLGQAGQTGLPGQGALGGLPALNAVLVRPIGLAGQAQSGSAMAGSGMPGQGLGQGLSGQGLLGQPPLGQSPLGQAGQPLFGQRPTGQPLPGFLGAAPGSIVPVRIQSILPPGQSGAPQSPALSHNTAPGNVPSLSPIPGVAMPGGQGMSLASQRLQGVVLNHPPGGQMVVSTPSGTLLVPQANPVQAGSIVEMEVLGKPVAQGAAQSAGPIGSPSFGQGFTALSTVLKAAIDDQAVMQALRPLLVEAGPKMAAQMAVLGQNLRDPVARSNLVDTISRGLEKANKGQLGRAVRGEVEASVAELRNAQGEWRAISLPFVQGAEIEPIRLYVKDGGQEGQEDDAAQAGSEKRFVVDLDLTMLGRFQLDGWVKRNDKVFDLIIRTEKALSEEMRLGITAIFVEAATITGIKGGVTFLSGVNWAEFAPRDAKTRLSV